MAKAMRDICNHDIDKYAGKVRSKLSQMALFGAKCGLCKVKKSIGSSYRFT